MNATHVSARAARIARTERARTRAARIEARRESRADAFGTGRHF